TTPNSASCGGPTATTMTNSVPRIALNLVKTLARRICAMDRPATGGASLTRPALTRAATAAASRPLAASGLAAAAAAGASSAPAPSPVTCHAPGIVCHVVMLTRARLSPTPHGGPKPPWEPAIRSVHDREDSACAPGMAQVVAGTGHHGTAMT